MTAVRVVWVTCDAETAPDCEQQTGDGSIMGGTSETVTAARHDARDQGWHVTRGGRDVCGPCWEAGQR